MPKITFMGAGSTVFAKNVLGDCMMTPVLEESEIALYDIDPVRLDESAAMLGAINRNNGSKARISKYLGIPQRKEALRGASYVVNAIQVGGYDPCTITDFEIPKKVRTQADDFGYARRGRSVPRAENDSGNAGFCGRYGRGLPGCMAFELHKSHGDADRRDAPDDKGQNGRAVPQRPGLRPDPVK